MNNDFLRLATSHLISLPKPYDSMRLSLATILCPKITRRNCMVACAFALVWMFGGTSCKNDVVHSGITDSELEKFRGSAAVESLLWNDIGRQGGRDSH